MSASTTSTSDLTSALALGSAIEQLANELFHGGAASGLAPQAPPEPSRGPSAVAGGPGGGGAAPAVAAPPLPGGAEADPIDFVVPEGLATSLVEPPSPGASTVTPQAAPHPGLEQSTSSVGPSTAPHLELLQSTFTVTPDAAPPPSGFPGPGALPAAAPVAPSAPAAPGAVDSPAIAFPQVFEPELVASEQPAAAHGMFDPYAVKRDFPILAERVRGKPLVWLDNAATTQKPQAVIDRLSYFYEHENSNVHRAAHTLAARATDAYEGAREKVRRFLDAPSAREIVFVRGATEAINLVAQSWGRRNVGPGDEIVVTWLEHHANIVPWQMLCAEKGAKLKVAPVDDRGDVILEAYERLLGPRTRIVAFPQVSNALGTVVPAREMVEMAHRHGARVLVDGAQAVSHMAVDVQALDCDFYVLSGHKVFAPTGVGALFGKAEVLDRMPPWQGGGNMIADVTFERTTYQGPPGRFEAGTGTIADAVGLGAALDYLSALGLANVSRHEHDLLVYAEEHLRTVPGLCIIGNAREKAAVVSFVVEGLRTEEIGGALDQDGIAVRSGHHCAQPILRRFGLEATVRASLAPYNTREDIDALVAALRRLVSGSPRP